MTRKAPLLLAIVVAGCSAAGPVEEPPAVLLVTIDTLRVDRLNARNPSSFVERQTAGNFGQPTRFAGDFRQPEQRLAQIGARIKF